MSDFVCSDCGTFCHDTDFGYVTGCVHYPPEWVSEKEALRITGITEHTLKRWRVTYKVRFKELPRPHRNIKKTILFHRQDLLDQKKNSVNGRLLFSNGKITGTTYAHETID